MTNQRRSCVSNVIVHKSVHNAAHLHPPPPLYNYPCHSLSAVTRTVCPERSRPGNPERSCSRIYVLELEVEGVRPFTHGTIVVRIYSMSSDFKGIKTICFFAYALRSKLQCTRSQTMMLKHRHGLNLFPQDSRVRVGSLDAPSPSLTSAHGYRQIPSYPFAQDAGGQVCPCMLIRFDCSPGVFRRPQFLLPWVLILNPAHGNLIEYTPWLRYDIIFPAPQNAWMRQK